MKETDAFNLTGSHFFRFWMPYAFQRIEHPKRKHVLLPLNRNYKPLGQLTREHVDYDVVAASHGIVFARDPGAFPGIWTNVDEGLFFMYNDNPGSRTDYFERFERLMAKGQSLLGTARL